MKNLKLTVKTEGADDSCVWEEDYDLENGRYLTFLKDRHGQLLYTTPEECGQAIVDYWNNTLRDGDRRRALVGATGS